jgi:hypothetical protein
MPATTASCATAGDSLLFAQRAKTLPDPPESAGKVNPAQTGAAQTSRQKSAKKAMLLQNEREFRAGVERLYKLTSELRDEVQKTVTSDVLSIGMYRKTEEIEKLAKQLKLKAKG